MRILILTQAVDTQDPVLGFFHRWIEEIAGRVSHVTVICLHKGQYSLPGNVEVYSLGKEVGAGRIRYLSNLITLLWKTRKAYNAVFVHMNEEYVLLAGWWWKLAGKRVYLWRNHFSGSFRTDIAAAFCTKVFCTSRHSYTAKYRKTILMPVGVDTERFQQDLQDVRRPNSILFLSRMAPAKRPDLVLRALRLLKREGVSFSASFVGSPTPEDMSFYEELKGRVENDDMAEISFHPAIPNAETPPIYQAHQIFVNATPSGAFDKTMFEAAASGCIVVAVSEDFKDAAGEQYHFHDEASLVQRLQQLLAADEDQQERMRVHMASLARGESLATLADRLVAEWSYEV